ncbi:MAG TPA: hypothetical protein VIF82_04645 [Burkholderiaceae bacterium]|jgi:ABC-type nickel/cobalt efflux system permease component RcnA
MKNIRQFHLFLGTFFAPAIIFFAFSGILQLFGLHESRERGGPPPIAWIAELAEIHKNQHLRAETPPREEVEHVHDEHDDHESTTHTHLPPPKSAAQTWALKAFFLLMAIGLISTSLIGIIIALQNPRTRRNAWISLALGIALPLLLLFL